MQDQSISPSSSRASTLRPRTNKHMESLARWLNNKRGRPRKERHHDYTAQRLRYLRTQGSRIVSIRARDRHVFQVMNEEQRISVCKTGVNQIYTVLRTTPQQWRNYLGLARSVIAHIDTTSFMQQAARITEQIWMIEGLQRLALADPDNGEVPDISNWCTRQWMVLYSRDSTNVAALRGLGRAWLARAQAALARIHRTEGSSSSSGGSSQWSAPSITSSEDERQNGAAQAEAERRSGTADYVEARGFLQPAVEYFERAVAAATAQRTVSGDLLAMAAEAYMSLGNASSPRVNEQYFRRALQLLRAAGAIPGYTLGRYLQQYLDTYGRLLEQ